MTREDAQALLDVARLDISSPPPIDGAGMMRRYVDIISQPGDRRLEGSASSSSR